MLFWVSEKRIGSVYEDTNIYTKANHENEDWIEGRKTEDVVAFLDRLYTAKRKIEKRIAILGGQDESVITPFDYIWFDKTEASGI